MGHFVLSDFWDWLTKGLIVFKNKGAIFIFSPFFIKLSSVIFAVRVIADLFLLLK